MMIAVAIAIVAIAIARMTMMIDADFMIRTTTPLMIGRTKHAVEMPYVLLLD